MFLVIILFQICYADELVLTKAVQSSTWSSSTADRAIDGHLSTYSATQYSATQHETSPWLRLYFNKYSVVEQVLIERGYSASSSCQFNVYVYSNESKTLCGTYTKSGTYYNEHVQCGDVAGHSVMIQVTGCGYYLRIHEIKVFGQSTPCIVPIIAFTKSMTPAAGNKTFVDKDVVVTCARNYRYGSETVATIKCNATNFPSSCRKVAVTTATEYVEGGVTATLTCTNEAYTAPTAITWYFGNSSTALYANSNYNISALATTTSNNGDVKTTTNKLEISAFARENVGDYKCQSDYAAPILNDTSQAISISVLYNSMIPMSAVIKTAGEALILMCSLTKDTMYSTTSMTWWLGSAKIDTGLSQISVAEVEVYMLNIPSLTTDSSGTYKCSGTFTDASSNSVGPINKTVEVTVRGFITQPATTTGDLGDHLSISCIVKGDAQATFKWKKDTSTHTDGIAAVQYDNSTKSSTSVLKVHCLKESDAGNYTCIANFSGTTITSDVATVYTSFSRTIQKYHNKLRKMHSAKELTWNNDVSKLAQNWCEQLVKEDKFEHSSNSGYGENLFRSSKSYTTLWAEYATKAWYTQEQYWDYENSTSKDGNSTSDFTQIVWQSTTELGCGLAVNDAANSTLKGTFVCCNYKPPGNNKGRYADNVGCKLKWRNWINCTARQPISGTTGCYKIMEQYCSCNESSKCSGIKEALKTESCKCEDNTCKWEWKKGECKQTHINATPCKRRVEQECSCEYDSKCSAADKKMSYEEECSCNKTDKCEWRWGKAGKCLSVDDGSGKCYRIVGQECSCKSDLDCEGSKSTKRDLCECQVYAKLLGGKNDSGNLAVMFNGSEGWRSVCDDGWGERESNVACRNIGFKYGKQLSTQMFQKNNLSFVWSEVDCPASATNLNECEASKYGKKFVDACQWKEKVAIKCCNEKFKIELKDVIVSCNKQGVKCKFTSTVYSQKHCLQDIDIKDVEVQVYQVSKSGAVHMLGSLNYKKKKNTFYGRNKFVSKPDSDCYVFVARIPGIIRVEKRTGTC